MLMVRLFERELKLVETKIIQQADDRRPIEPVAKAAAASTEGLSLPHSPVLEPEGRPLAGGKMRCDAWVRATRSAS